jgi:predicted AAA+ superfamily ATPase
MRYLDPFIRNDLEKKMVFLGGPRQCGKTTLAKSLLGKDTTHYFNWDFDEDRRAILKRAWPKDARLVVFDELHKLPRWKSWIKGIYDTQGSHRYLVTGSARLDVYRRGGDSLLGRYHYWRLHPFTQCERPSKMSKEDAFSRLMRVGGFPEPFLDGDERQARRWRRERTDRVLRDDLRDLEQVRNMGALTLFVDALRERVGGLVVLGNIAEDLQVAQKTLKHWLELLERMYLLFVVPPYTKRVARAIQKPPKVFFFDNADVVGDEGARFENLVATHLLKRVHFLEDRDGFRYELRYVRDKDGREVDFVILRDGKVHEMYEAKWADTAVSKSLVHFANMLQPLRAIQIVGAVEAREKHGNLHVVRAQDFLTRTWRETSL